MHLWKEAAETKPQRFGEEEDIQRGSKKAEWDVISQYSKSQDSPGLTCHEMSWSFNLHLLLIIVEWRDHSCISTAPHEIEHV